MNATYMRRRGVVLLLAVVVMSVVAGLLSLLALCGADRYRGRQADRVRNAARAITDSAIAYARVHIDTWSRNPPAEPIQLEVSELLPPRMTGSAAITFVPTDDGGVCRLSVRVDRAAYAATDKIDLDIR